MRRSGLSRHIVVSMSLMALSVIVMVILSSYVLYAILVTFYPGATEEPASWAPSGPELVWMAGVTLIGLGLAIAASVRLSQRILGPLNSVVDSIRRLANGDLGARAAASHHSLGEVALLVDDFNAMARRLQNMDADRVMWHAAIAHELRTPITNLLTQTEVALARPRSAAEYQDVLLSNAEELQRLSRMIGDMLFLARTEHGGGLPEAGTVVLEREVTELFDFYDALAEERGITLALHGQGQVRGDRLMLRRALGNLLSNALRHTPRGATIAVTVADTAGATEVTVRNPGPPIPADALPHLFERFFRAERSRTRGDADGAGLGLAITRAIMLAHGGTLCVASGPAATCFTLRFGA